MPGSHLKKSPPGFNILNISFISSINGNREVEKLFPRVSSILNTVISLGTCSIKSNAVT